MRFETRLSLPMAVDVAILGAAVLVGAWDAEALTVPDRGSVPPTLLVGTTGENAELSG